MRDEASFQLWFKCEVRAAASFYWEERALGRGKGLPPHPQPVSPSHQPCDLGGLAPPSMPQLHSAEQSLSGLVLFSHGFFASILWDCGCCPVAKFCPSFYKPLDCRMPGFPVDQCHLEFAQTHVHWVTDAIQPSHPLSSPSPPAFSLLQHHSLFQWVSSSHQVARVLELQLQHQSFQLIFRTDFL